MSERKVLNKYYPPDFDPSKIPRMKLAKNRQYTVRLMAPFNMRCVTCGEYIYKGKKFNARKEDVEGQDYLGIRIYRFYIKCTRCLQEISFKTDPQNTDYEIEAGATRNFMALKLAEEQAQKEEDERKEDESTNPMKLLENRTKQSKQELELLESLEELRDLNRRQRAVDYDQMLVKFDTKEMQRQIELKQQEDDEKYIKSVFGAGSSKSKVVEEVLEIEDRSVSSNPIKREQLDNEPLNKKMKTNFENDAEDDNMVWKEVNSKSTSLTVQPCFSQGILAHKVSKSAQNHSIGLISKKGNLNSLVRLKKNTETNNECVQVVQAEQDISKTKPTTEMIIPTKEVPNRPTISSGLSLLGSYSDSESD